MVRRYSRAERLVNPRVLVSASQEPAGDWSVEIVDPSPVGFRSTGLPARQPGVAATNGGTSSIRPSFSSVFRNASCAMRSSGPVAANNEGTLPEPAGPVAL